LVLQYNNEPKSTTPIYTQNYEKLVRYKNESRMRKIVTEGYKV